MPSITRTTPGGAVASLDMEGRITINGELVGFTTIVAGGYGWTLYGVRSRAVFTDREDARRDLAAQLEVFRDA